MGEYTVKYPFPTFSMMNGMAWQQCCSTPKGVAKCLIRVSFGLSLLFVGLSHYMNFGGFSGMVSGGLGPLGFLGQLWAYLLPALMILGGLSFITKMYTLWGTWAAGLALASIPAGLLLKSVVGGVGLDQTMPFALNAVLWILWFWLALKDSGCCNCGSKDCAVCSSK